MLTKSLDATGCEYDAGCSGLSASPYREERNVYEKRAGLSHNVGYSGHAQHRSGCNGKMSAPELQLYRARQVYEEAMHTWTYQHCIETLGLNQSDIYNRYRVVPAIYRKNSPRHERLQAAMRSDLNLRNRDDL